MNYIEVNFTVSPKEPFSEILMAELQELPFDTFQEHDNGLSAYIPENKFSEEEIKKLPLLENPEVDISFTHKLLPAQNWNAVWESSFEPIEIGSRCVVRAEFHEPRPDVQYEIIITPKMSFGTGHHATTSLMLGELLALDVAGKSVLDMGCGTGVLAILSAKKDAKTILAVDNDEWAVKNTHENIINNKTPEIEVVQGDAALLENKKFDVILANINRNVLLNDMPAYANSLTKEGSLLISGFFEEDIPVLLQKAAGLNLQLQNKKVKNNWAVLYFINLSPE